MGLKSMISSLLSFTRVTRNGANVSDSKVDPGGGANVTGQHFAPAGDDAHPMPGIDYVLLVPGLRSGTAQAVGYVDPLNPGVAAVGEKRTYARDGAGAPIVESHLKNTGESIIFNENGTILLRPDGSIKGFNANGSFELKVDGSIELISNANATFQANADGTVKGFNANGFYTLEENGDFNVNGTVIDSTGNVDVAIGKTLTSTNGVYILTLTIDGKELKDHTHSGVTTGGANTGGNN